MGNFKKNFLAGLATLLPLALTVYILYFLINIIGGKTGQILINYPILKDFPPFISTLVGVIVVFIAIYLVGILATTFIGGQIIHYGESILIKLPLVRGFYRAARQFSDTLFGNKPEFSRVVLLEFPKEDSYAVGFVTTNKTWKVEGIEYLNIFVPTTPNPTSGWYLVVPRTRVKFLPFSVEEGLQMVISGGIIMPKGGEKKFLYELTQEIQETVEEKGK